MNSEEQKKAYILWLGKKPKRMYVGRTDIYTGNQPAYGYNTFQIDRWLKELDDIILERDQ